MFKIDFQPRVESVLFKVYSSRISVAISKSQQSLFPEINILVTDLSKLKSITPNMNRRVDFERVLQEVGEFGLYQKVNYILLCLPVIFAAANSLTYVFTAASPTYR